MVYKEDYYKKNELLKKYDNNKLQSSICEGCYPKIPEIENLKKTFFSSHVPMTLISNFNSFPINFFNWNSSKLSIRFLLPMDKAINSQVNSPTCLPLKSMTGVVSSISNKKDKESKYNTAVPINLKAKKKRTKGAM